MHFLHILFTTLVTAQVYYMYKFIYSIPLKYEIPETENEYVDIGIFLRGNKSESNLTNGSYRGTHTRKHQPLPHLEQMKSDNNTASIYMFLTNLDAVDRF